MYGVVLLLELSFAGIASLPGPSIIASRLAPKERCWGLKKAAA
jgi:hypothetical protein